MGGWWVNLNTKTYAFPETSLQNLTVK